MKPFSRISGTVNLQGPAGVITLHLENVPAPDHSQYIGEAVGHAVQKLYDGLCRYGPDGEQPHAAIPVAPPTRKASSRKGKS